MNDVEYEKYANISKMIFYAKFEAAEVILQPLYRKLHPSFDLLLCENLTVKSLISEDEEDEKLALDCLSDCLSSTHRFLKSNLSSLKKIRSKRDEIKEKKITKGGDNNKKNIDKNNKKINNNNDNNEKQKFDYSKIFELKKAIDVEKQIDDEYHSSLSNLLWAYAIKGEVNLLVALLHFSQLKYHSGLKRLKKSERNYRRGEIAMETAEQKHNLGNIKNRLEIKAILSLGAAFLHFSNLLIDLPSPLPFRSLYKEREKVMAGITEVMSGGTTKRPVAMVMLAWIRGSIDFQNDLAIDLASLSLTLFPENGMGRYIIAVMTRRKGLFSDAINKYHLLLRSLPYAMGLQTKMVYEEALTHYLMGDWHRALPLLQFFTCHSLSPSLKAIAMMQTGVIYKLIANDDQKLGEYLRALSSLPPSNKEMDEYARRWGREYTSRGELSEFDIKYHLCFLLFHSTSQFPQILTRCDELITIATKSIDFLRVNAMRAFALLFLNINHCGHHHHHLNISLPLKSAGGPLGVGDNEINQSAELFESILRFYHLLPPSSHRLAVKSSPAPPPPLPAEGDGVDCPSPNPNKYNSLNHQNDNQNNNNKNDNDKEKNKVKNKGIVMGIVSKWNGGRERAMLLAQANLGLALIALRRHNSTLASFYLHHSSKYRNYDLEGLFRKRIKWVEELIRTQSVIAFSSVDDHKVNGDKCK